MSKTAGLIQNNFLRRVTGILALGALYFVTGKLGLLLAAPPGFATTIWPPSGIAMGALLVYGSRLWPGIFIGSFLLNAQLTGFFSADPNIDLGKILSVSAIAAGSTLQALAGWALVKKFFGWPLTFGSIKRAVALFILCGPIACVIAASFGTASLYFSGLIEKNQAAGNWLTWWGGDTFGVLVFMPILILFINEAKNFEEYRLGRRAVSSIALLTAIIPLIITFYAWKLSSEHIHERSMLQFSNIAQENEKALLERIHSYAHILLGGAGFYTGSDFVSRREWKTFSDMVDVRKNFPGMNGIGFIAAVKDEDVPSFLEDIRSDGAPNFTIHPPGKHPENFIISYLEPFDLNDKALGLNIAFEQNRYEAATLSRASGKTALTKKIHLVQDKEKTPGFLLLQPMYKKTGHHEDTNIDQNNFIGWIYAPFVARNFFTNITNSQDDDINVIVYDGEEKNIDNIIYSENGGEEKKNTAPLFSTEKTIAVYQQKWTVVWESTPHLEREYQSIMPAFIMMGGILFSSLYGIFILSLTRRTAIIENLVREKTAEAELQKSRALEAAAAKSDFLAKMSHEIRTPINGILGFIEILGETNLNQEQKSYIEKSRSAGQTLLKIIGDILDLSKIEAGKTTLESEPFDLREALDICVDVVHKDALQKKLTIETQIADNCPDILVGDKARFQQIILNLLVNAVKFTAQGSIRIGVGYNHGILDISVTDTGIGIAPNKLEKIFESFVQEDSSMSRKYGGSGLGLTIAKQLVTAMNGTIRAESVKGNGTKFFVSLPLPPAAPEGTKSGLFSDNQNTSHYNILIVEDTALNQELMQVILSKAGHKTTLAENGRDAISILKERPFDLVLMDIQMPVMDGFQATRIIREELKSDIPIIALTAHALPEQIKSFFECGMDDFLIKPLNSKTLLSRINSIMCNDYLEEHIDTKTTSAFDPDKIKDLQGLLGKEKTAEIINDFKNDIDRKLTEIQSSLNNRDNLHRNIHVLASNAGNLGLEHLNAACRRFLDDLENLADDEITQRLDELSDLYKEAAPLLQSQF